MKKNFFKKLALVMALTLAVGSVPAASAEAAAAPAFKSTKVTVKEGQTKKYSTENSKKYSAKFKIGNKKVATISYSKGSKSVKVTGVAAGKTTLRADFKAYKSKKEVTVRIPVTVKAVVEEPIVVEAALSAVKQTASNAFTATFTADASQKFTKDNFSVAANDGSTVLSVNSVEYAADGLSAKVTLYGNFTDGTIYNVTCGDANLSMTASVGAVARVAINTASAQQNVATNINFTLYDATGIDVTPSIALDANCIVSITGSYSGADLNKASAASITMDTIGDTAEVTVTYNSNAAGAEDITATQTITCVDPKAVLGTKLFANTSTINDLSNCAKFYMGITDNSVSIEESESTNDVYFCAKEANGDVISYDSYEAESSNEDVMTVNVTKDNGKFAQFSVTGNTIGNAQINITATKNGKLSYYTIPVSVTKNNVAVKMTVSVDRPTMSNVNDSDYKGTITAQLYDANGKKVSGTYDYELITETKTGTSLSLSGKDYRAANAVAKTYTIKVTGADNETGKTFVKNVNVVVKALPATATAASGSGIKLTYQVELANGNVLDQNPGLSSTDAEKTLSTRLYATYNGLFAGYVRDTGAAITVAEGNIVVHADSQLTAANVVIKYGNLLFNQSSDLLGVGADAETLYNSTKESIGITATTYDSVATVPVDGVVDYNEVDANGKRVYTDIARTGLYTIEYELQYRGLAKPTKKTQTFTVKNTVVVPTVTVLSRNIDSFDLAGVKDAVKTNVDMNNDNSEHESVIGIANANPSSDATRFTVKYVLVKDTFGTAPSKTTWNFWVPINTTFKAE